MEQPSRIKISWKNNPDLQKALGERKAGDKIPSIELRDLVVAERTDEGMDLTYSKLAVAGYVPDASKPKEDTIETGAGTDASPVSIVMPPTMDKSMPETMGV